MADFYHPHTMNANRYFNNYFIWVYLNKPDPHNLTQLTILDFVTD